MALQALWSQLDQKLYFRSFDALLAMDGHGAFVWSAYLIATLVVLAILLRPVRRKQKFLQQLSGELKRRRGGPIPSSEVD
jgi:heme exporter protein D